MNSNFLILKILINQNTLHSFSPRGHITVSFSDGDSPLIEVVLGISNEIEVIVGLKLGCT